MDCHGSLRWMCLPPRLCAMQGSFHRQLPEWYLSSSQREAKYTIDARRPGKMHQGIVRFCRSAKKKTFLEEHTQRLAYNIRLGSPTSVKAALFVANKAAAADSLSVKTCNASAQCNQGWIELESGAKLIPQGCRLSPINFNMFSIFLLDGQWGIKCLCTDTCSHQLPELQDAASTADCSELSLVKDGQSKYHWMPHTWILKSLPPARSMQEIQRLLPVWCPRQLVSRS